MDYVLAYVPTIPKHDNYHRRPFNYHNFAQVRQPDTAFDNSALRTLSMGDRDRRRQSGLWNQNAQGYYEQVQPPTGGPYQYYAPPASKRESYTQRVSNLGDAPLQPPHDSSNGVIRSSTGKSGGQYPMQNVASKVAQPGALLRDNLGATGSDDFARTQHVDSVGDGRPRGSSDLQRGLKVDPYAAPANLRTKPWSPPLDSATSPRTTTKTAPGRQPSNASDYTRRGSVPDRSPLQKLEGRFDDISKEEKRARLEEAEQRVRQRSLSGASAKSPTMPTHATRDDGRLRGDARRVVSDGSSKPKGSLDVGRRESARQATAGASAPDRSYRSPQAAQTSYPTTFQNVPTNQSAPVRDPRPSQDTYVNRSASTREREPRNDVDNSLDRSNSRKYRAKHAGFAGADAAVVAGEADRSMVARQPSAAERGKAAYERRRSQQQHSQARYDADVASSPTVQQESPVLPVSHDLPVARRSGSKKESPITPDSPAQARASANANASASASAHATAASGIGRSGSKKLQKQPPANVKSEKQLLQGDRMSSGSKSAQRVAEQYQDPDILPRESVETDRPNEGVRYAVPPQTAGARQARQQVGFAEEMPQVRPAGGQEKHHSFKDMFRRQQGGDDVYRQNVKPLDEWRSAGFARLTADDLDVDTPTAKPSRTNDARQFDSTAPWWEMSPRERERAKRRASASAGGSSKTMPQYDGPYEEEAQSFRPPLFLKCGPLLRYTGIRHWSTIPPSRDGHAQATGSGAEREIWRGSIMIVTEDDQSDYTTVPTLRLFAQPMDLLQTPAHLHRDELPPEFDDPVAGQVKLSRTGRPLYVRPVHEIDGEVDLSREENNQGLYSATRTPLLGPQGNGNTGPDAVRPQITFRDKSRIKKRDGERLGKYKDVRGIRLYADRGFTFWRFSLEIELASTQRRVAYRINSGPAIGFWVPARGEAMNMMFHSCNGFSLSVKSDEFSGPDPLWRDVLNKHQSRPFHVMIGGGDQIYNDASMRDTVLFKEWLQMKNPQQKHSYPFSPDLQDELETFYLDRYAMWFSQGLFAMAGSQIPMVNVWDDHDIIDGYGSYPHHFMSSRVFTGLGAIAFKYYMLFQHQSLVAETTKEEPSWLLGASPGPYIAELSRNIFLWLGGGKKVALLGMDCRTERMRDEILSQESYDLIFDRARHEIVKGQTKHLIVLLGVPIAYPRLNFLENILTSRVMDPIKAIGRTGMLGGFVNKFDGGVEILDDLDDHWTAKHHKAERNWFIQELQELAAEKSVRVTILGGDVHLGAVGQFYSNKRLAIAKDRDHRYMPNIVSSAIVNTPPPPMMADVLNKRNKIHHLDEQTDEDMIPMFPSDVDGSKRNNVHLLPRRNYAIIREYLPGSTPPSSPPPEMMDGNGSTDGADLEDDERQARVTGRDKKYPPGSMGRTQSLTRGVGTLVRRLSGSGRSKNPPVSLAPDHARPYSSHGDATPPAQGMQRSHSMSSATPGYPPQRPTNQFLRRPTGLSEKAARKAAAKGGADANLDGREPGHIDLQGGLDITLNMEVDQKNPEGDTVPYRLLVPALWYSGEADVNTARFASRGKTFMGRLRGLGKRKEQDEEYYSDEHSGDGSRTPTDGSRTPSPPPGNAVTSSTGGVLGRLRQGHDGQSDSRDQRMAPSAQHSHSSYNKGYALSGPPLGANTTATGRAASSSDTHHQPPTRSFRQSSAPAPAPAAGVRGYDTSGPRTPAAAADSRDGYAQPHHDPRSMTDDSLTPSDEMTSSEMFDQQNLPPRRQSKAERFFGIGDGHDGAGRTSAQYARDEEEEMMGRTGSQSKKKWMIWK